MNMNYIAIIVTVKNRVNHFIQTFPSLITQYGTDYEIVMVDFASNDALNEQIIKEIQLRRVMFSPYLQKIIYVKLEENLKFNPRKAKNLGVANISNEVNVLAFSDVDTFIGVDYIGYWTDKIQNQKSFFITRQQESRAMYSCRLKPEINYGNIIVYKDDFYDICGWDESVGYYGGDDDDLCHRLKLKGLREINPMNHVDAKQFSILHGDEVRTKLMEDSGGIDKAESFQKIYNNKVYKNSNCQFLNPQDSITKTILFDKKRE